jgi:hypothetical protein
MWLVIAAMTVHRAVRGSMFYAPCLGTDLYMKARKGKGLASKSAAEKVV